MTGAHATDPLDRIGVYKRLEDVPDRYRLANFADAYEGQDTWLDFLIAVRYPDGDVSEDATRRGNRWKDHMASRGRHHALATPDDVTAYSEALVDRFAMHTAMRYWTVIERMYWWLMERTDHPHVYHPFLIAAASDDAARRIWDEKIRFARGGSR